MQSHICCSCYGRRNSNAQSPYHFMDSGLNKGQQISCIDSEISRVEDAIVHLVRQRASLKRQRNTFSPAVNLPTEILALIFEFACLPTSESDHLGHRPCTRVTLGPTIGMGAATPLFIGTVCSAWRNVAYCASQLWNTLTVYISNKDASAQANLLQDWLTHSGQRPLSIKVIEDESSDNDNDEDNWGWGIDTTSTAVIDVLAAHSDKWHTIDLFLPSAWKSALEKIRHELPRLSSITIRVAEGSPSMTRVDAFAFAPQLREVTLVGYPLADVVFPWSQLHRIDGQYFTIPDCLNALQLCPELRHCQFEQLSRSVVPFAAVPIRHEHLESLELVLDTEMDISALLGMVTLPALKELVLSLLDDEPLFGGVLPLIRRSGCALRQLHLVGITPSEGELVEALSEMPRLKALLLLNPLTETGGKLTHRVLDLMCPDRKARANSGDRDGHPRHLDLDTHDDYVADVISEEPCLLPNLESFVYQGAVGFSSHDLVQFLQSRWHISSDGESQPTKLTESGKNLCTTRTVSRLQSLVFTTTNRIKFEGTDATVVQRLVEEGMHLEFLVDTNTDGPEPGW